MALSAFANTLPNNWVRVMPPVAGDGTTPRTITVTYLEGAGQIMLALSPPIGPHTIEDHKRNALSGSIMFKLLMTLGEQLGARVTQNSLVGECRTHAGDQQLELGDYPEHPIMFEKLCLGFSETLMGGVPQELPHDEA